MKKFARILLTLFICIAWLSPSAQTYKPSFAQVLVTNGLSNPTAMVFAPDGRIFVAQQGGSLRVVKNNVLLATPFLTVTVSADGERGLIGVELDPDFESNHFIYVYYTVPGSPAHNRVSRFTANGDVAQVGSEQIILELDALSNATNHNGGAMHFGLDGKLYVAVGENANSSYAQNQNTYHGKLLRINKDGSIPSGNPFTTGSEQRKRVWAYGLRNPFTFSIHPETGRILINDVGQVAWEEINDATIGGQNFGWPTTEGSFNATTHPAFSNPIYSYDHGSGDGKGCAITGGTFFYPTAPTNYPSNYIGWYFFQDLCNAWINTLDLRGATAAKDPFATGLPGSSLSITNGTDGNLYFLSRNTGSVYKIIYNNTTAPYITNQPANVAIAQGQTATLSVTAMGTAPLTYQWRKNGNAIAGATSPTLTLTNAQTSDAGSYSVVISNAHGNVTSSIAAVTVAMNILPVATISAPVEGTSYAGGNTINFNGGGTDAEDGALPSTALIWNIDFYHDVHKHDEPPIEGVSSGSFTIPTSGETSDNVWYRLTLTVKDSQGMTGKDSVDIFPRKSTINLTTEPSGLKILLDGQPIVTPVSIVSVEGIVRTFGVVDPQVNDDISYTFESWSNEGEKTQSIPTPVDDVTLTAKYSSVVGVEEPMSDGKFSVYPNPSNLGEVNVRIYAASPETIQLRLVDVLSRAIVTTNKELQIGMNDFQFQYGNVKNGIYSVVTQVNGKTVARKLFITK